MTENLKRLFLALEMPDPVRADLVGFIGRLKTGCRFVDSHPRWVEDANLHVTLVFLGLQPADRVPVVQAVMDAVTGQTPEFPVSISGAGLFPPNSRNPKVVSSNVQTSGGALTQLHRDLVTAFHREGFDVEQRPYRPHLTLARLTSVKSAARLAPLLQSQSHLLNTRFPVTRIVLYQSLLNPVGPEYKVLHEAALTRQIEEVQVD